MEFLLNRYRNLTVLLVVIVAQLLLIAYQVKTNKDVPLIRVWAVTAVTPIERVLELIRRNTWVFVEDYFVLVHTHSENEKLRNEVGRLKLENHYLKNELSTADRARALVAFQGHAPSKTVAARIIGNGTGANSKIVFVDRGSGSGVEAGMAVITPDGIIGKIVAAYPTASLVLLLTDANFAAGVISQKNAVRGTLKGQGHDGTVLVDFVQNDEQIEVGEWFFTSGEDRVFPKGFPVGPVTTVRNGRFVKEIYVTPSGFQNGVEQVLIVVEAVHQAIPNIGKASSAYKLLPAPPQADAVASDSAKQHPGLGTDADRLREQYRQFGLAEKHTYGEGGFDTPLDFTKMGRQPGGAAKTEPPTANKPALGSPAVVPDPSVAAGASPKGATGAIPTGPAKPKTIPAISDRKPPSPSNPVHAMGVQTKTTIPAPLVSVKPKPRNSGPLLVTDPTDADPTEVPPPALSPRPERAGRPAAPELTELGEPKPPKKPPKRAIAVDENTELLPSMAPPPPKAKSPDVGATGNVRPKVQPAPNRQ